MLVHSAFLLTTLIAVNMGLMYLFYLLPIWEGWHSFYHPDAAAKSLQSCPTLCDPIDGSPPGSSVPGIFQARTLAWVAISFSNAWKWTMQVKSLSCVRLLATPWTAAYEAPPSMGFSRQEYWSGVPSPSPKAILILLKIQVLAAEAVCLRILMADCTMVGEIFCFQP